MSYCSSEAASYAGAVGFGGKPIFRRPIVLLGLRYYDPSVGRFINRDPIDYGGGINLYTHLHDNPINGADPLGTDGGGSRLGLTLEYLRSLRRVTSLKANKMASKAMIARAMNHANAIGTRLFGPPTQPIVAVPGPQPAQDIIAIGPGEIDPLAEGLGLEEAAADAALDNVGVYQSFTATGDVEYVGITNNFKRRLAEYGERFLRLDRVPGLEHLTRQQARSVEQTLIEEFRLAKNGGTLLNRINSIARTNPLYGRSLEEGRALLQRVRARF
ncbi:MAG TPA: RHS repeat-associated core domain-containing protein [Chthonomonadales bacterium]|nr:RHS repeat-associated core domain-containing protein [Chthonomonadales bacterium]